MAALPPGNLSLSTLASLAELSEAAASRRAAPVTRPGGGEAFSAAGVTAGVTDKTEAASAVYAAPLHRNPCSHSAMGDDGEWEERAAILEYEGGWPRAVAEAIATRLMLLSQRDSTTESMRALDRELIDLEQRERVRGRR